MTSLVGWYTHRFRYSHRAMGPSGFDRSKAVRPGNRRQSDHPEHRSDRSQRSDRDRPSTITTTYFIQVLHSEEEKMLYKVGEKYRLKDRQIASLIGSELKITSIIPESHDLKMNQLYDLVMMIYADGLVEDTEVRFCEELMAKFGFKRAVVKWMIDMLDKGKPPTPEVWEEIKLIAAEEYVA